MWSEFLGVAEASLSRWETGAQIQQRWLDKLLCPYFEFPDVRQAMAETRFELSLAVAGEQSFERDLPYSSLW